MSDELKALGHVTPGRFENPDKSILETFPDPHADTPYEIELNVEQLSSVCPVTGQPDYAVLKITYWPGELCVETKSLKLYVQAYRNQRTFMEAAVGNIMKDLRDVLQPDHLLVEAWYDARGGIAASLRFEHSPEEPDEDEDPGEDWKKQ